VGHVLGTMKRSRYLKTAEAPLVVTRKFSDSSGSLRWLTYWHSTEYMILNHDKAAFAELVNEPQQAILASFSAGTDEPMCQNSSPDAL
jgi:hypothetical protein